MRKVNRYLLNKETAILAQSRREKQKS